MRNNFISLLDDLEGPPPLAEDQGALCLLLNPRIRMLAEDVWALAQKSPSLVADPALVALAVPMLDGLRRLLRDEPGVHMLPRRLAERISLHGLALTLRRMQCELAVFMLRRRPEMATDPVEDAMAEASEAMAAATLTAVKRVAARELDREKAEKEEEEEKKQREEEIASMHVLPPLPRNSRRTYRRLAGRLRQAREAREG